MSKIQKQNDQKPGDKPEQKPNPVNPSAPEPKTDGERPNESVPGTDQQK